MKLTDGWLNVIRCGCYVLASWLTPLAALLAGTAETDTWPSVVRIAAALLTGLVAATFALRAYLDGSNERYQQKQEPKP